MDSVARPAVGGAFALGCLVLLGVMPVIANGRPAGSSAVVFALWMSVWQLIFALPPVVREWRSGDRGMFGLAPAVRARLLVVTGFTGTLFALAGWFYVLGFERAGAVNAAIALQAYPLFAAGLEAVLFGRRKGAAELGFTALVLGALYWLATGGTGRLGGLSAWFLVALAVPALWTVAHVMLRQTLLTHSVTPAQVTASRLVVVTGILLPLAAWLDPAGLAAALSDMRTQGFAAAMGLAYYLELLLWFHAVRHIPVSLASTITVPAPAVTMALAWALLGDAVAMWQVGALVVVVFGLVGVLMTAR